MKLTEDQVKILELLKLLNGEISGSQIRISTIFTGLEDLIRNGYIFCEETDDFIPTFIFSLTE